MGNIFVSKLKQAFDGPKGVSTDLISCIHVSQQAICGSLASDQQGRGGLAHGPIQRSGNQYFLRTIPSEPQLSCILRIAKNDPNWKIK
jgi:hypothetical protein